MPPVFSGEVEPRLTFKEAVGECISKYATFLGRARRSEYWWFSLFILIVFAIQWGVLGIAKLIFGDVSATASIVDIVLAVTLVLSFLFLLIPSLAVQVRRLHDVGRSGWWVFWGVIASMAFEIVAIFVVGADQVEWSSIEEIQQAFGVSVVGGSVMTLLYLAEIALSIALLVFSLQDSHKGENKYVPKVV